MNDSFPSSAWKAGRPCQLNRIRNLPTWPCCDWRARWAERQHIGAGFKPTLGYLAEANVMRGNATVGWWRRTQVGSSVVFDG